MRICLANLDFVPYRSSGLAVYGEDLARGLAGCGHQVTVVCSHRPGLPTEETIEAIQVYRVPQGKTDWIGYAWHAGPLIERLAQQQRFHVVHFLDAHFAYRFRGPFVASLFQSFRQRATSEGGLPYHAHWRGLMTHLLYYHAARFAAERPAVQRASHLIASSQATADEFCQHYGQEPRRVSVVPLGIDLERFRPLEAADARRQLGLGQSPIILYVGFGTPRKGLHYLAQAFARLESDARLVMVGRWEPGYRERFYRAVGAAAERVVEAGYVPDDSVPVFYSAADIVVLPSLLEGFGYPVVEALACGAAVVATAVGSIPEVVGPGGLLVPSCNPAALAQALGELLADPQRRREMGRAGRAWVRSRFERGRMVRETLEVYERFCTAIP
ncbi:MAG: glycosyltransferase family 4 protein [Chloroflexota bacterium]